MQKNYAQIQFAAANYSKLQGLRLIPIGLFVTFVALWTIDHQGDLGLPLLAALGTTLLYWLIDRFYAKVFGRIRPIARMRTREIIASLLFSILAWLAAWLDMGRELPFSGLGLVVAASLFEDFWRATSSIKNRSFNLYPENLTAACLILVLSFVPLAGVAWWELLGFSSQFLGMLTIIGILCILAGLWGHVRLLQILPLREAKPNEDSL